MKTLKEAVESKLIIDRSTFIGHCFPVNSINDIEILLTQLKALHPKRSHLCYAYRINDHLFHMEDDGEPKHTAGKPIYDVIMNQGLDHVLCSVIRYFGGVLLGAGPLTRAYRSTTVETLLNAHTVTYYEWPTYLIHLSYEQEAIFLKRLGPSTIILEKTYLEEVTLLVASKLNEEDIHALLYDAKSIETKDIIWHEKSPL
jgi:uncharacterized YigZ family protein